MDGDGLAVGGGVRLLHRLPPSPVPSHASGIGHPGTGVIAGRGLRILYVSYPLLPVTPTSCGGAEQMLWTLEAEMVRRGHETVVAACERSQVAGRLFSTGTPAR